MGKKSLIKSTSKKKRAPKKAATSANPKQTPPARKEAAKAKPAAKTAKKEVPKKAAPKAQPVSVKDLLKKQFDVVLPKVLYTVPPEKAETSTFTAPELLAGFNADDTKRIKGLLANTYSEKDLKAAASKAPAAKAVPKKTAPKAKPVSVKDLLKKQFDIVTPKVLYTVPSDKVGKSTFTAPELLAGFNTDDTKRIKGILANTYSEKDLKAAAEKAAAEKAAAEKAAAEKAAAEKAAAEKAAAEKAAAEKRPLPRRPLPKRLLPKRPLPKRLLPKRPLPKRLLPKRPLPKRLLPKRPAAEKAAAEKAAAEKAAAEKAAAEKAAAEKAAAEKAAAEKAAAEKAAAEKAAAEKAAAEKAEAIRKAAAQKSDVKVSYEPAPVQAPSQKPSDPVDNSIKLMAAGLAFLILLVIGASASNSFKYYLADKQGTLEIWKGKFAPMGKKMLVALPGVPVPEALKAVYSSDEVYPLAFQYYIDKADALLDVSGIPDLEGIKATLKTALAYGSTNDLRRIAYNRLDNIDRLILSYKADVAASRGTIVDLNAAIGFLEEADRLTSDDVQKEMIAKKIAAHQATVLQLEEQAAAEQAAAEKAAAEQAAAEQAAAEQAAAEEAEAAQADTAAEVKNDEAQPTEAGAEVPAAAEKTSESSAEH